jgi:hypothetical protein
MNGKLDNSLAKLRTVLQPYGDDWKDFILSASSPLTNREAEAVFSFELNQSHDPFVEASPESRTRCLGIYSRSLTKLKGGKSINQFKAWLVRRQLRLAGFEELGEEQGSRHEAVGTLVMDVSLFKDFFERLAKRPASMVTPDDDDTVHFLRRLTITEANEIAKTTVLVEVRITASD